MCSIDWTTIGTLALVVATLLLVIVTGWVALQTRNLVIEQRSATIEQHKNARAELELQQKPAKTQLAITIRMDMEERWDRPAMLKERADLARMKLRNFPGNLFSEGVPEFFESLAKLDDLDYLIPELTYNGFSFHVIHWWFALRQWIAEERAARGNDPILYEEFERFANKLLDQDAARHHTAREAVEPSPQELNDFLEGEALRGEAMHRPAPR